MGIFGRDGNDSSDLLRQILEQLIKTGEGLAALKQQVADQQHAIDQTRQDTTAAINTGLAEIRSVARDGISRGQEIVTGPLASIGSELVAIRSGIAQLDGRLKEPAPSEPAPTTDTAAEPAPKPQAEPAPHNIEAAKPEPAPEQAAPAPNPAILRAAAGIAHANIEAHRDTWAFLIQAAGHEQHFHIPGKVDAHKGFVNVRVSGPSLVAAITSLNQVTHTAESPVTQAIADHIHGKITDAVKAIIDNPRTGGDGTPVRIVIDDRAQADDAPDAREGDQPTGD